MLDRFVLAARGVMADAKRLDKLLRMMNTRSGAIAAVQTVLAIIERTKPIPTELRALLAVAIYKILVEHAMQITKTKPSKEAVQATVKELLQAIRQTGQPPAQRPQQGAPMQQAPMQAPAGLLSQGAM
jgi:uncharacterized protein YhhL (DUF1145 family)